MDVKYDLQVNFYTDMCGRYYVNFGEIHKKYACTCVKFFND